MNLGPTLVWIIASILVVATMVLFYFTTTFVIREYAYKHFKMGDILINKSTSNHKILITSKRLGKIQYKHCNKEGKVIDPSIYQSYADEIFYQYKKHSKKEPHLRIIK